MRKRAYVIEVHWDIKKGAEISATVKIGDPVILPGKNKKEVQDIGYKAVGKAISVEVSDVDEHVCHPTSFPVKNFIEPVTVKIKVTQEEKGKDTDLGYIPLTMEPAAAVKAVLRKWTGKIPETVDGTSLVGKTVRLQFEGTVTDANCCHTKAVQEEVDLSAYQARMTVLKVEIEEPDGLPVQTVTAGDSRFRLNPSCFEWQFVHVDNERVVYHTTQLIDGLVEPIPPASYNWSVSAGTLNNSTTEKPTYVPKNMPIPDAMATVELKLRAIAGNDDCMQQRTLEVYRDHLERDFQNWGTGIDCGAQTAFVYYWSYSRYGQKWNLLHSWNCFGSAWHAFDGTHDGFTTDLPSSGFTVKTYDDPIPWSTAVANLQRGDIVSFYTYDLGTEVLQHAHTCMGSSSQMYGANNQPVYGSFVRNDGQGHSAPYWEGGSWRWWLTSSDKYYDQINAGYQSMHPGAGKLLNRIKVHRR